VFYDFPDMPRHIRCGHQDQYGKHQEKGRLVSPCRWVPDIDEAGIGLAINYQQQADGSYQRESSPVSFFTEAFDQLQPLLWKGR
jgi:hypothetical protein